MKRNFAIALGLILYFCFSAWDRQKGVANIIIAACMKPFNLLSGFSAFQCFHPGWDILIQTWIWSAV